MDDPSTLWTFQVFAPTVIRPLFENFSRKTRLSLNNSSLKRKCVCREKKSTYPLGLKKAQNIVAKIIKGKLIIVVKIK